VPLPAPTLVAAQAVLGFAYPSRDTRRDERFIQAASEAFPHVVNRVMLTPETGIQTPHLLLASTSSQLAVSALQADFQVRFYDEYIDDVERGIDYVRAKLATTLAAFEASGTEVASIGVIVTLHFKHEDGQPSPVEHLRDVHLRSDVRVEDLQDIVVRIALRLRDIYYLNITISNYETRALERPVTPAMPMVRIRPWEGRVEESGLEMALDMNNVLEARTQQADPRVTSVALDSVANVLRGVATSHGPRFLETGEISVGEIVESSQASTA
jgi:hypothetical protein